METITPKGIYSFLQGGGETGELIRAFDWSKSSIGHPHQWPQSLRTTLGIMLHSAFPMFLFWGPELICFYNDAFRPSLGNEGKHPAIGKGGKAVWPEIWDFIGPLIQGVMATGEPVWFEDQLVPFFRNGCIEDIYWTFSYSPAYGDDGQINGVFVTCTETTEKVNNFRQLEESKDQLAFSIDAAELATWDYNPLTNTFIANERYTDWFGLPAAAETDNELALVIIASEDRERVITAYKKALDYSSNGKYEIEYTIRPAGKPERVLRAKGKAWFNEAHIAYRFTGTLQDVTEQKRIEEEKQRLIAMIEASHEFIGLANVDGIIEYVNVAALQMLGWKDFKGRSIIDCIYPDDRECARSLQPLLFTEGHFSQEIRLLNAETGKSFWILWNAFAIRDEKSGDVVGLATVSPNITERKKGEQALIESEKNLRNVILQAPVAMCILKGPEHVVEIANERMFELWGKTADDVMQKPLFDGVYEAKNQGFEEILYNVYATGETFIAYSQPVELRRRDKIETVYVNFVYEPYREADGRISAVMAVANDVTEQVLARQKIEEEVTQRTQELAQANEALLHSNQELARSNVNLEEFAYAASHDLKEPVRKIHFFSERLRNSLGERMTTDENRAFERMELAAKRMNTLIDDLLSYSQVSVKLRTFEVVDMDRLLALVLNDLDLEIAQKEAQVHVDKLFTIQGHQRQLEQAFQNLIGNALKYSKPGIRPQINITCNKVAGTAIGENLPAEVKQTMFYVISVSDNGIGFEQKDADRIFNVFTRLHGNAEYKGTGVGLSIVRKVIENHNGYIKAEGELGTGSTFKVYLPAD